MKSEITNNFKNLDPYKHNQPVSQLLSIHSQRTHRTVARHYCSNRNRAETSQYDKLHLHIFSIKKNTKGKVKRFEKI